MKTSALVPSRRPSLWRVARNQFALIDQAKRFPLLLAALATGAAIGFSFESVNLAESFPYAPLLLMTVVWPILVWRGEAPAQRTYHRVLPVNGMTHDLLKVAAGAVWLCLGIGLVLLVYLISALLRGDAFLIFTLGAPVFLNFFTGPLLIYLFISLIPILANRPLEWLIGLGTGIAAFSLVGEIYAPDFIRDLVDLLVSGLALEVALYGGYAAQPWMNWNSVVYPESVWFQYSSPVVHWPVITLLWLSAALLAVCLASYWSNRREPAV